MRSLALSLLAFLGSGRQGAALADPLPPAAPPVLWSAELQSIADGNNRFALELLRELREPQGGNLVFSPFSAHAALAMTAAGAKGMTRQQMVQVLHLPAGEKAALAAGDLGRYYSQPRKDLELNVANALWGQTGFPWRPDFLTALNDHFGAGFHDADFKAAPEAQRQRINAWAEKQTRGKIKDLIAPGQLDGLQRLVLANAIYFKGVWQDPFNPRFTAPMPFLLADGDHVAVPTMRREGGFRMYLADRDLRIAELPYRGGGLSMVLLVPGKADGLPALEARLTPETLADGLAKARPASHDIYLPKFRIETGQIMLKEPLRRLGMVDAFDPNRADLRGMYDSPEQLNVDFAVQKAFVDVNEEGTEAAAATGVAVKSVAFAPEFRVDRPFLFLIRDTRHGTILFVGRVHRP